MGRLQNWTNAVAGKLGYSLMPTWRLEQFEAAAHLRQLFDLYKVDLVLDVGANVGQYRDFLRHHVGYTGWIASFEPAPDTFARLQARSLNDIRWKVFQVALGAQPGTATFNVSMASTLSSFHAPDFTQSDHAAQKRETLRQIEVRVDTVDRQLPQLLESLPARRPYLKMDTQGFDLEVLRGAEQSLPSLAGLQFEGSVVPLYRDMPPFTDMLAHLVAHGFALSDMFPVTKDPALKLIEFDCVMVKA